MAQCNGSSLGDSGSSASSNLSASSGLMCKSLHHPSISSSNVFASMVMLDAKTSAASMSDWWFLPDLKGPWLMFDMVILNNKQCCFPARRMPLRTEFQIE